MALIGGGAVLVAALLTVFGVSVFEFLAHVRDSADASQCQDQLRRIGGAFPARTTARGADGSPDGAAAFLEWLDAAGVRAELLRCPSDPRPATALGGGCSYAVRDFTRYPLEPRSTRAQIIAADAGAWHRNGINVLNDNGSVQFLDRTTLRLGPDEPIVVGPDSPHPELRTLCILPQR